MSKKFLYNGAIDYPGVGEITDEDVYKFIKKHSRLIDRLNPAKMTEMSLCGQLIIARVYENIVDPDDSTWRFYGKNGFFDLLDKHYNNEDA